MSDYAINDFEAIRRRQEELKAQQDLALSGSTLPVEEPKNMESWVAYMTGQAVPGYECPTGYNASEWPYAGTAHEWRGFVKKPELDFSKVEIDSNFYFTWPTAIYQKQNFGPKLD